MKFFLPNAFLPFSNHEGYLCSRTMPPCRLAVGHITLAAQKHFVH